MMMSTQSGTIPDGPGKDQADSAAVNDVPDGEFRPGRLLVLNRLRRWRVSFGNPALGTYAGDIVTLHPRSRGDVDSDDGGEYDDDCSVSSDDSFSSCSSSGSLFRCDETDLLLDSKRRRRIVVMVNVPPHQVPDGVLNLVRGHRPYIEHVRIVIGSSRSEEAEHRRQRVVARAMEERYRMKADEETSTRRSRSQTWACEEEKEVVDGDDHPLNSSFDVASISEHAVFNSNDRGTRTRGSRSTSLDFGSRLSRGNVRDISIEEEKHSAEDHDDTVGVNKNYHILFVMDSEDSAETFVSDLHRRAYTSLDESETCSVYHAFLVKGEDGVSLLGPFFASSTSSPNETEHCQCPVCLEMLYIPSQSSLSAASSLDASSSILTTVCNHSFHIDCLARWQDSPCPVCRYDHSGLNETLSRCHVCAATARNYVCLICGAISCANGQTSSSTSEGVDQTPQAPSHLGHALQHYEETLHAYALDTETQHVWDFAGGGYVHRLLQNLEDGKIVEGTDPRLMEEERGLNLLKDGGGGGPSLPLTALERSTIPTYSSSSEDDEAIHRKLEGFAGQYYTLLKSQLEQQRIFYEGQLEAIRREHEHSTRHGRQSTPDLISALKQERNQLEQRCMTLRRKHKKVSDDAVFLENMNESLDADRLSFRRQIADAQAELAEAKQLTHQLLTPVEERLSLLMLQLENGIGGDALSDWKSPSS